MTSVLRSIEYYLLSDFDRLTICFKRFCIKRLYFCLAYNLQKDTLSLYIIIYIKKGVHV